MKITKFSYQSFLDNKGLLLPIDFKKELKVNIKRIFFLSGNKKFIRGDHAHKKCIQCFIQIQGNSTIELFTKNEFKKVSLSDKKKMGIIVRPKTWIKVKFNTKNNLILVLCSNKYDEKDYIRDFSKL